jgi:hypothetical protein
MRWASSLLAAGGVLGLGVFPLEGQTPHHEQTHFSAEDEGVRHPVPIPGDVMAILRADESVRNAGAYLESEGMTSGEVTAKLLSASQINLGSSGQKDLIVVAEGPLRGANITTFWIFLHGDEGYRLAFKFFAHDLIVMESRFNGYRDLEMLEATAATVTDILFRFDGREYKLFSSKAEAIK